jgi:hypothetical protein
MVRKGGNVPGTVDENAADKALRFHRFQQQRFGKSLILIVGERRFEPPTPLVPNQVIALLETY